MATKCIAYDSHRFPSHQTIRWSSRVPYWWGHCHYESDCSYQHGNVSLWNQDSHLEYICADVQWHFSPRGQVGPKQCHVILTQDGNQLDMPRMLVLVTDHKRTLMSVWKPVWKHLLCFSIYLLWCFSLIWRNFQFPISVTYKHASRALGFVPQYERSEWHSATGRVTSTVSDFA